MTLFISWDALSLILQYQAVTEKKNYVFIGHVNIVKLYLISFKISVSNRKVYDVEKHELAADDLKLWASQRGMDSGTGFVKSELHKNPDYALIS